MLLAYRVLIATVLVSSSALADDLSDVARGRAFAERVCAECHSVRPGSIASPRPDAATFGAIANTPGMTAMALTIWLQTPHREMPHLILDPKDRDAVVAYITSLKTSR